MLQWSYSKNSVFSYLPFDTYREVSRQKKCQMPVWNTHVISCFQYCAITFPEGIIGLYSNTDTFKIKNELVNILLLCISLLFDFSNAPARLNKKRLDTSDHDNCTSRLLIFFKYASWIHISLLWRVFTQFFTNETSRLENVKINIPYKGEFFASWAKWMEHPHSFQYTTTTKIHKHKSPLIHTNPVITLAHIIPHLTNLVHFWVPFLQLHKSDWIFNVVLSGSTGLSVGTWGGR